MNFSDDELERYARHIVLPGFGGTGQAALKRARVAVIGAGGLGSPCLLYLAAAGVGRLTIIDDDAVALSNLQRQILFGTADAGAMKAEAAASRLRALNPHVATMAVPLRLDELEGPRAMFSSLAERSKYSLLPAVGRRHSPIAAHHGPTTGSQPATALARH